MKLRRWLVALFVSCTASSVQAHDMFGSYLQRAALQEMAACRLERCVSDVVKQLDYMDAATRIIRAAKLDELRSASAPAALLEAIPLDPVAFHFAYEVTSPKVPGFDAVSKLYYRYFRSTAREVAKRGERTRDFLLLKVFSDGEMAEMLAEQIDSIRAQNPNMYCEIRATFTPAAQRLLRGCVQERK